MYNYIIFNYNIKNCILIIIQLNNFEDLKHIHKCFFTQIHTHTHYTHKRNFYISLSYVTDR